MFEEVWHWYSIVVAVGIIAGGGLTYWRACQRGLRAGVTVDLVTWGLVGSIVIGRLFFILNPPPSVAVFFDRGWYFRNFLDLQIGPLAVWSGGLGPAGLLLGAFLSMAGVLRLRHEHPGIWGDVLVPGVLLTMTISSLASIAPDDNLSRHFADLWASGVIPLQVYLSGWFLIIFVASVVFERRLELPVGFYFVVVSIPVLTGLFILDFFRSDQSRSLFGLSGMQVLCVVVMVAAFSILAYRRYAAKAKAVAFFKQ